VAGSIGGKTHGVAKSCNIIPVKVTRDSKRKDGTTIMSANLIWQGFNYIRKWLEKDSNRGNQSVVNFSIYYEMDAILHSHIRKLGSLGSIVCHASGNNNVRNDSYPPQTWFKITADFSLRPNSCRSRPYAGLHSTTIS
jgi:hypothetical protein